ncbi:hypothetical protein Leryth_001424 [Lithospermum erythrorhizon]|uniref:Centromere protein X n=1 Tax=Lithospermum erythrorhizon TaxID=34254 RepID=A0AAV3RTU1_LITER|nr:hypothetical protein Leryth_001424 [Lithospermum erythrorhizon]
MESTSNPSPSFDPDLIHAIYKHVWRKKAAELEKNNGASDVGAGPSRKNVIPSGANANALKLSCELLRQFVVEAVQRAASIAEAEGATTIAPTHLERILPQLLLDF